jgi:hypothetical protein
VAVAPMARLQAACHHQARGPRRCRSRRSSRTSPRCTTGSTNWAWPSR